MKKDLNELFTTVLERLCDFDKYEKIQKEYKTVDVATNEDFQKLFNEYYKIRRNANWRNCYYTYFQENKDNSPAFDDIIDYLFNYALSNRNIANPVEASFSSKMLATIDPNMPILDQNVLDNMSLSIEGTTPQERLRKAKRVYKTICDRYNRYLGTEDCKTAIAIFDKFFPHLTDLASTRKIDFFLWSAEKAELKKAGLFTVLLNG